MSTPIRRPRAVVATLAAVTLILLVAACGHSDSSTFDKEGGVDYSDRPSMEVMLDRYQGFQDDLIAQLDKHFGKRTWSPPPNDIDFSWGDCEDPAFPDGASASPPSIGFDGTYPRDKWHEVRDLVIKVGKKHGFTEITMHLDQSDALDFAAADPKFGAVYDFGMGNNAVFGITTGCHRWETPPPPVS